MIGNVLRLAIEVAKKTPWWKKVLIGAVVAAGSTVATTGSQKAIDKLFKDRKKSLKRKLEEIKMLWDGGNITEQEYQKYRTSLLDWAAKEPL
jgi:uncharacterized membrane protein YoaK (UPF0700 family)